ncbi:cobaltochelatase CobT-related protein [Azospirillum argentinense]|uniref:cobaltochelatase CobT-related protein n=1 Tax=Azospirillum argentinense TaxID=2970906 RepID=UPI0032DEB995
MLAGMGIRVTQQGMKAFVETDKRTLKPQRVNIPFIPDNATEDLILAIQGFIDHEVAHILFSDWAQIKKGAAIGERVAQMHNILEDTLIERLMGRKFPGSVYNIERLHGFFIEHITKPALARVAGDPRGEFAVLIVPACRAWSGQKAFQDFMAGHWTTIEPFVNKIGNLALQVPKLTTTAETLDLAIKIVKALNEPMGKGEGSGKGAGEGAGKAKTRKAKPGEDDGEASGTARVKTPKPGDGDEDEKGGASAPAPTDEVELEDEDEEGAPAAGPEDDESGDGEGDETAPPAGAPGDDEGDDEGGDEGDEGDEDGEGAGESAGESDGDGEAFDPTAGWEGAFDGEGSKAADFDEGVAEILSTKATEAAAGSDYVIFTKDWDRIEPFAVDTAHWSDGFLTTLDEQTRHMVGVMQKDIERMMAARSQVIKVPGHRSGRLHGASLHRLTVKDDRVFRRTQEARSDDVVVTLLVDNSGSMRIGGKIQLATTAAYALSQTLERVAIKHEVIGFTTSGHGIAHMPGFSRALIAAEEERIGRKFSRWEPLYMPIYKGFTERLTPNVKRRFAFVPHKSFLANNIDGECVEIATRRNLAVRGSRHVLMVLSDGMPYGEGDHREQAAHLKRAVAWAEKAKVETVGIGIMSEEVARFYPKHMILNDIAALPRLVMSELRRILQ